MIPQLATTHSFNETLMDSGALQHHAAGTILFEEGDVARGIYYIVQSGSVELSYTTGIAGSKRRSLAHAGEILGLGAVISQRPCDYTARVRRDSTLGYISRESLMRILDGNPEIWFSVLRLLSNEVDASYAMLRAGQRSEFRSQKRQGRHKVV